MKNKYIICFNERIIVCTPSAVGAADKKSKLAQEHTLCWVDDEGRVVCYNTEPDWSISVSDLEELISR